MAIELSRHKLRSFTAAFVDAPVDIASLAAFRFLFGMVMAAGMVRFICKGWVHELYGQAVFYFPYPGFAWVHPWPEPFMQMHFVLLVLLAIAVAVGFYYRVCITLFFLGFTYVELIDQTAYLNHYYLVSLLSGLMIFLPAHRGWSLDVYLRPGFKQHVVPAWTINLLRFQIATVYLFAGLAKINADWLLHAEPLKIWLAARSDLPLVGPLLLQSWVACTASWLGAAYDLGVVFFLVYPRTRKAAFLAVILFHVGTWILFNIGMFPWIMIAVTTIFFRPDWPRRFVQKFSSMPETATTMASAPRPRFLFVALACYAVVQICLPLRPYIFNQGSPAWSCRGFNLAWQVMVAEKTGYAEFYAVDSVTHRRTKLNPREYVTARQELLMAQDPYLIALLARQMAASFQTCGKTNLEIHVNAYATINGRPSRLIIDPAVNLAKVTGHGWISPMPGPQNPIAQFAPD
jgi:vitamin K-dependent gamma-carboxylase